MNGAHVAATSGVAGQIATVIVWLSDAIGNHHWFPVDSGTAIAIASLIVSSMGALGVAGWNAATKESATVTKTETVDTAVKT